MLTVKFRMYIALSGHATFVHDFQTFGSFKNEVEIQLRQIYRENYFKLKTLKFVKIEYRNYSLRSTDNWQP